MDSQPETQKTDVRKKLIHLGLPLAVLILLLSIVLIYSGVIKKSPIPLPLLQQQVKVELKTEYKNPFKKESQFVNPFESYKNPFVVK